MELVQYQEVRKRLIEQWNILNNREYTCLVRPAVMMSIDELRNRETMHFRGSVMMEDFYSTHQTLRLKVSKIIDIIPNMTATDDIIFRQGNLVMIEIYETIQSYLANWSYILRETPEYGIPPIEELEKLENLAFLLFEPYRKVKPFVENKKIKEQNECYKDKTETLHGIAYLIHLLHRDSLFNGQGIYRTENDEFPTLLNDIKQVYGLPVSFGSFQTTEAPKEVKMFEVENGDSLATSNNDESPEMSNIAKWFKGAE